ncbi:MAG TPA: YbaB/EbfC family nucleoid-associated protein [Candidatus Absconditabacterales bacterium]|nr:YbaB/EbfC family nucleoid-associated protein [Candidatus Absconditabacterales bacterium]HNG97118.1 YbaB/EbfC family nucleoid-associated protein [Candidatus Absconditabacterales bacterium]
MSMFGQMGQLKELYDKYKKLQEALKNLIIRAREDGVLIDMSGEMDITDVQVEDVELLSVDHKEKLEKAFMTAYKKAKTKAQQLSMEKTKEILGFDPQDMLGGMMGGGMPKIPGLS